MLFRSININNKNRIYNPNKLSKVLTKAVDSLYKKQYPKESKPKRRIRNVKEIPTGSADVLLRRDAEGNLIDDRFLEFINRYEQIEAKKQNPQEVELKYIIETINLNTRDVSQEEANLRDTNRILEHAVTGSVDENVTVTEEFVKQTTVYGGDEGLKLYIKKKQQK